MPRRNRTGSVGPRSIHNPRVAAESRGQIVYVAKRNVVSRGRERTLALPRNELAMPPDAHGRGHSRPDDWNSVAVIDDANFLRAVENVVAAGGARCAAKTA